MPQSKYPLIALVSLLALSISIRSAAQAPAPSEAAPEPVPAGEDKAPTEDEKSGSEPTDEELMAELEEEEVDVTKRPAKGKGVIWGVVSETAYGETLIEAPVQVLGSKTQTVTDLNGRFRLELPPGTYTIRISYEIHKPVRIDGIVVAEGKLVRIDAKLDADEDAVDVVEVVEEANKSSLEGVILARQRATVVGDSVGRTEIARTPDRNAAQAAQRVVGATVVGGRFVFVRGLGERYTNALLNGVPLPSPEPDRAAVPLDLFPTGVLNSLTIAKTFTPDVPGDFAGGSVRVETREIPAEPLLQVSLSGGYNTESTFRERPTYRGGSLDWLGLDDGTRALPDEIPAYKQATGFERPDGTRVDDAELTASGRALNSYMSTLRNGTPPDHGLSVVAGNSWQLGGEQKIGAIGSVNYSRGYTLKRNEIRREFQGDITDPRGFSEARDYRVTTGSENVNWGGFGSLSYKISSDHQLSLLGIRTTIAENFAQIYQGFNRINDIDIHATKLGFVTRALNAGQLRGEHDFRALQQARLEWHLSLSSASRDQPDTRDTVWGLGRGAVGPTATYRYTEGTDAGRHFFAEQTENQYGGGLDWTQPLGKGAHEAKLKLGALVSERDRDFAARNLHYGRARGVLGSNPLLNCESRDFNACADRLFRDANIGPTIALEEVTQVEDSYRASLGVYAGYLMTDLKPWRNVRLIAGQRIEHTHQVIEPYDQFGQAEPPAGATIKQTDILPAISAAWSFVPKANLRGAITRTLARPQLRELAPFTFSDFFAGRPVAGNAALELTHITNVDLRVEYFPTLQEVLAFSLFFKQFEKPIEPIQLQSGELGLVTFQNAQGASLIGIELEARKNLDFIAAAMKHFGLVSNLTLAQSKIQLAERTSLNVTNESRPLVNQAPFVLNIAVDYANEGTGSSARILYNVSGPRIVEVGANDMPDVYEHPRGMIDLTFQQRLLKQLSLRLAVRNLLNSAVVVTQGCENSGLFGSTWRLSCDADDDTIVRRYTEGTSFALSATYDF